MSVNVTTKASVDKKGTTTIKKIIVEEMLERKAKGLCFHCDEKFSMGHKYKKLFSIEALGYAKIVLMKIFLTLKKN